MTKYECDICSEKFSLSRLLYLHKKTHDDEDTLENDYLDDQMELEHSNDENQEGLNETAAKRRKSNKILNKDDSVDNADSIEIKSECSSIHNDGGEHESILKEKATRKINKSRRKPKTPNKIKISFSKSKK